MGAADRWQWDFGDGGTSTAQHPVYTYTTAGVYTVTLTVTDTDTAETDTLVETSYIQVDSPLLTTVINYEYDDLYRLTGATYTGAISATYDYAYDSVGNMTAFTETVTSTQAVERTFDGANQLITSFDVGAGTTSYTYDDNGNLTVVYPPGSDAQNPVGALQYAYDQRNLLVNHSINPDGTGWVLQAAYVYDGANDRLQQVDHTSASPVTTTYTNDVVGLTEVLVADDGASQVYNLFGLDLIQQEGGSGVRTLLVDGLGSVRLELAGGAVEAVTTYSPYGEVLAQSGTSGTVYGFTGEQEDSATGLLYLRARYYNSTTYQFQTRDSHPGYTTLPPSQNGYSYAHSNPVKYTDPSGHCIVGYSGEVRMSEYPYGTSGICRNTEHWIIEGHKAMEEYHASLPPPTTFGLPKPDAVGVYSSIHGAEGIFSGQTGIEVLYNLDSADLSLFAVIGFGREAGADLTGELLFMAVYNIGSNNLNYAGNFVGLGGRASAEFGLGGQYSITPSDVEMGRIFAPRDPFSIGIGPICGYGLSGGASLVEYIPVLTTNMKTHVSTYHLTNYFYDYPTPGKPNGQFDNGFITGLVTEDIPHFYRLIQEKIEEQGWDRGRE